MIGHQIGPYKVLNLLGRGDIGMVYRALHSQSEQLVAIKMLSPELSANPATRDRILNQANRQAGLFHPHVVNVLKYLKDSKGIYLVMEYVQGESLEKRLTRVGFLERSEALRIVLKILDAIAFMHKRGIHHRHLKPSDILITGDGNIKVKDFGIAKVFGEKGISVTGMRLESLWYMSPEQLRGENVEAASDIYSLGITLYRMLTGQVPFHGKSRFEVMKAHMEEIPRDPAAITPELPRAFCDLILKSLAKNPQDRFQSAEELTSALLQFTEGGKPGAAIPSEGPLLVQEEDGREPGSSSRENDASPIGISEEELLFPDRFDRKVFYLLMGTGMVLIGLLMHILFFGDSQKGNRPEDTIPTTFSPAYRIPSSSALPVTVGDGTQTPETSPPPEAAPESAPRGTDGGFLVTPPFPQAPFSPGETGSPPLTQPAPSSVGSSDMQRSEPNEWPQPGLAETPRNEELVEPNAAPPKADPSKGKKIARPEQYSENKRKSPANRESSEKSGKKPEGENQGWRIIK
ncbi:serine/threonine protein kinase [Desulfococcus sp.]|uniref:serine/threonine protein kinase n=1 Tax=Desulfococcus sp. TaxID=2025834 RepID=UPI0035932E6D